ncbi:apolipoprotein D-like [Mizuhopecten yessoensis]|uniref:apolipoprotein D-like n=1 Tax=Mizuhopecten yessoensis TaxID=6573 RepID=UPI000B45BD7C|nr:apolipoprotein D-like [Mizuhopecten yessoensis]
MNRIFLIVLLAPAISAFLLDTFGLDSNVHTVTELDVSKYLGRWYQMFASQSVFATFERGAVCVIADYTMSTDGSGRIIVLNSERLKNGNGSAKIIHGYATPSGEVGKLSVHLETVAFSAPYWVVQLGPATFGPNNQYQYAVVSDNLKATLFVLARDPDEFKRDHEATVTQYLNDNGFTTPINKPISTYHGDDCLYNDKHQ